MRIEGFRCPLCDGLDFDCVVKTYDYFILEGQSPEFQILKCDGCKNGVTYPALNNAQMAPYYPDNYEAYAKRTFIAGLLQKIKYSQDIAVIGKITDLKSAECFEIGAGRGEFLYELNKKCKSVKGAEPSAHGCKVAKEIFNVQLDQAFAEEVKFSKRYQVVSMRHVLEHLESPVSMLTAIYHYGLLDNGVLFLKVPRFDSWEAAWFGKFWHGYDVPRHRYHFDAAAIEKILSKIGFKQVEIFGEPVPTDIIRSLKYFAKFDKNNYRLLTGCLRFVPEVLLMGLCQILAWCLVPLKSGRIVITAKKNA